MKQINNLKIRERNHKFQVITPNGVVWKEFEIFGDAEDYASETTDFIQLRKKFPTKGIFSVYGSLTDDNYLTDEDKKRYRYVMPAEYAESHMWIADCWIVDKEGNLNPGTNVSPIPVNRNLIGRKVK
jgi:hypothetical protein